MYKSPITPPKKVLSALLQLVPATYTTPEAAGGFAALCSDLGSMELRVLRLFLRHVALSLAKQVSERVSMILF